MPTLFVAYRRLYRVTCRSAGGATWLQVSHLSDPDHHRPLVTEPAGATWGYHFDDVNLALGNLVGDARAAERIYSN